MDLVATVDAANATPVWVWAIPVAVAVLTSAFALAFTRDPRNGWDLAAVSGTCCAVFVTTGLAAVVTVGIHQDRANEQVPQVIAQYVHDHHDLVALSPIELTDRDATFIAVEPDGDHVNVTVSWSTDGPVLDVPVPGPGNPVTVTVTPALTDN